ncbi:hypothetical protein JOF28_001320 [Leucobacter exalbidus]|uniref:CDP-glycerol glycerophosphotransferase, TagB/SpsB family n=1 Tax=Leucobacter exalbidus TaxID=662960 RepID=A0A940T3R5_9MICO|nr:CDP-glycerol glycerophosphotransferase family protein [Leucobacter exalbidus]MBP1326088.1 hypothetical protein [Leucobacter exalbidus]
MSVREWWFFKMILVVVRGANDPKELFRTLNSFTKLNVYSADRFSFMGVDGAPEPKLRDTDIRYESVAEPDLRATLDAKMRETDFIEFVDCGTTFSPSAFDSFFETAEQKNTQREVFVHLESSYSYRLNRRMRAGEVREISQDLTDSLWIGSTPTLLSFPVFKEITAQFGLHVSPQQLFAEAFMRCGSYEILSGRVCSTRTHEDRLYGESVLFSVDWYLEFVQYWQDAFNNIRLNGTGALPPVLQQMYLYQLNVRLSRNTKRMNKFVLSGDNLLRFQRIVSETLEFIDLDLILAARQRPIRATKSMVRYLLGMKPGSESGAEVTSTAGELQARIGTSVVERLSDVRLKLDVLKDEDGCLVIAGWVSSIYLKDEFFLTAQAGNKSWELEDTDISSDFSVFGAVSHRSRTFRVEIPHELLTETDKIQFFAVSRGDVRQALELDFERTTSKLTAAPSSYWKIGPAILKNRGDHIEVKPASKMNLLRAELGLLRSLTFSKDRVKRAAAVLRVLYFISRPVTKRQRHWVYYDRVIVAGDNGEYAYRFAKEQHDGVKKHYVLKDGTADAARFAREGVDYLSHKSLKHRLIFLNTELVFATHLNPPIRNAFSWNEQYFRDLFNFKLVYINHGLVVDRLDYVLNRNVVNADRMCVVSSMERQNLLAPEYGYGPAQVVETGFARYDGLKSAPRRRLLLAPTWRTYLSVSQHADNGSKRNKDFLESNYYRVYNGVINNPRLINALEKYDFELVYLLHPATNSQKKDFEVRSDRVSVLQSGEEAGYEDEMNAADLMITDYSGVQFDFAQMLKPVIYYHHSSIPPHYEQSSFDYSVHGFGPIATDEEALVDEVLVQLERGIAMEQEYEAKAHNFFTHIDQENSHRIYAVGKELMSAGPRANSEGTEDV